MTEKKIEKEEKMKKILRIKTVWYSAIQQNISSRLFLLRMADYPVVELGTRF